MHINVDDLTTKLKSKAFSLGFELFGIAPVQEVPELSLFEKWLDQKYAGEMAYLEHNKEKRIAPKLIVENAKSVIVCGINYHTDNPLSIDSAPKASGWISRYAWGDDYHDFLKGKIKALYRYLIDITGDSVCGRYYVDTGPVLEKVWAKYAGVGWIGKNTCLINQQIGSFLFLAVMITDVEFNSNGPALDHCGSCTRCLDACPTDALVAPYVLDANLCISYLTIEKRDTVPEALRSKVGRQIFGCDICQDVCPWNRKAPYTRELVFQPRNGTINPELSEILDLDEEAFREKFRRSPVKRAKLHGFLRNALIAAGNSGTRKLIPFVKKFITSEDNILKEHAHWAHDKILEKESQTKESKH